MRVGFFTGCFIDFVDPAIGRSLIRVLGRHGVEVVFPKKQTCCGIPVFMSGDLENGLDLLKINLEAFPRTSWMRSWWVARPAGRP